MIVDMKIHMLLPTQWCRVAFQFVNAVMPMFQYEWNLGGRKQELFNGDLSLSVGNRFDYMERWSVVVGLIILAQAQASPVEVVDQRNRTC